MSFEFIGGAELALKIDSYVDHVLKSAVKEIATSAIKIQSQAKIDSPVKSGRLRAGNQIDTSQDGGLTAEIYNDVSYSLYVHEGTSRMAGRPFLYNAWFAEVPSLQDRLEAAMTEGI